MSAADAVRSTFYLSPKLHQALRLKAAQTRRSMSSIVNDALRQALLEDDEDASVTRTRTCETALGYEAFLAMLKTDRTP